MNPELHFDILSKLEKAETTATLNSVLQSFLKNHHTIEEYLFVSVKSESEPPELLVASGNKELLTDTIRNWLYGIDSTIQIAREHDTTLITLGRVGPSNLYLFYNTPYMPEQEAFDEIRYTARLWYSFFDKFQTSLKLKKTSDQITTIKNIGLEIARDSDNQNILSNILKSIIATAHAEKGFIMLYDEQANLLKLDVVHGLPNPKAEEMINKGLLSTDGIKPGEGIQGKVFLIKKAMKISEASEALNGGPSENQSIICVPLCINDQAFGVVYVTNKKESGDFDAFDLDLVTILANNVASLVYQAKLMKASITDPLTGMYTRRHFESKLKHEIKRSARYSRPLSVLALDIDHFKKVNDTYGHQAGDEVLKNVTTIINQTIRIGIDLAARFGGEEFFIFLPESTLEGAIVVAERIRERVEALITEHNYTNIQTTISLGVSHMPEHAEQYDLLLSRADEALYDSKKSSRNCTTVWKKRESSIPV
ncbi:MAG: sensor domain-containing diguanylate cyclase [Fibrobacterales bacterium]